MEKKGCFFRSDSLKRYGIDMWMGGTEWIKDQRALHG